MSNGKRGIVTYKSYNFVDKDPALYVVKTVVESSGLSLKQVHEAGGATPTTMYRWFNGEGRTCRHDAMAATIRACKGEMVVIMRDGTQLPITPKKSTGKK